MIKLTKFFFIILSLFLQTANAKSHVIHISVDGLYADAVKHLGHQLPNYSRLVNEGASTLSARTDVNFTTTLPNHTSQFTGRQVNKSKGGHGWNMNFDPGVDVTIHNNAGEYITSIFDVVHDAGLSTTLFAGKKKFALFQRSWNHIHGADDVSDIDYGRNKIDHYVFNTKTSKLVANFINDLSDHNRHYAFLHIKDPDSAGHKHTWSLKPNSEYLKAVITTDNYLGEILSFVENNNNYKNSTVIILTSDHGGEIGSFNHRDNSPQSHTIPFFIWGKNIYKANLYKLNTCSAQEPVQNLISDYGETLQPVRNSDAANLTLLSLGLPEISLTRKRAIGYFSSKPFLRCGFTQNTQCNCF